MSSEERKREAVIRYSSTPQQNTAIIIPPPSHPLLTHPAPSYLSLHVLHKTLPRHLSPPSPLSLSLQTCKLKVRTWRTRRRQCRQLQLRARRPTAPRPRFATAAGTGALWGPGIPPCKATLLPPNHSVSREEEAKAKGGTDRMSVHAQK